MPLKDKVLIPVPEKVALFRNRVFADVILVPLQVERNLDTGNVRGGDWMMQLQATECHRSQ